MGGTVRDLVMGGSPRDLDLLAACTPERLQQAGFRPVAGKTTGNIWFRHLDGIGSIEISLLPQGLTVADELSHRDFTCNALALNLDGDLTDPLGGREDIEQRLLRPCSPACLLDDPLRIFRAFRFACDGWRFDSVLEQLLTTTAWDTQLHHIPVERFSRELCKALGAAQPGLFFAQMAAFGLGRPWLPELFRMREVPAGPAEYHPEGDLFSHAQQVLQRAASLTDDPLTRFCAFWHDIGKLTTDPAQYPRHHGHDEAGFEPAMQLCRRLHLPAAWGRALAWTARLHTRANNWDELRPGTRLRLADQACRAGVARILPMVSAADIPCASAGMPGWETALAVCGLNSSELGVDGERLDALAPEQRSAYLFQARVARLLQLMAVV